MFVTLSPVYGGYISPSAVSAGFVQFVRGIEENH
jgi:hypothetical protein